MASVFVSGVHAHKPSFPAYSSPSPSLARIDLSSALARSSRSPRIGPPLRSRHAIVPITQTLNHSFLFHALPLPNPSPSQLLRIRCTDSPDDGQEEEVEDFGVRAALSMLRFYKREISPILPSSCRYVPTCSEYSMEAYKKYGVVKGTVLTAWRLCRCNPLGFRSVIALCLCRDQAQVKTQLPVST